MKNALKIATILSGGAAVPFGDKVTALSPFLWWKMNEASGTAIEDYQVGGSDHDGTLTIGSGALGAAGIGDGLTSITFDGTATAISVGGNPSLTLGAEGTIMIWWKASMWTDNTGRGMRFDRTDSNNYIRLGKTSSNTLFFQADMGGGTDRTVTITSPNTTTDWFILAGTWSASATNIYQVLKGGSTVVTASSGGVGTWSAGAALWQLGYASNYPVGNLCHLIIFPTALTQAQLQDLAKV